VSLPGVSSFTQTRSCTAQSRQRSQVVSATTYKGTVITLDCINIKRNKDWDEATTFPDPAQITTIRGTIGYIAADDHLKLLRT
jgi:hypothetical protein